MHCHQVWQLGQVWGEPSIAKGILGSYMIDVINLGSSTVYRQALCEPDKRSENVQYLIQWVHIQGDVL